MKARNRYFLGIGLLTVTAVLVVVFWPMVYDTLILPVALLLWAFLRVFLSLDQTVYWVLLIGVGFLITIRSLSVDTAVRTEGMQPVTRLPASRVAAWRAMIASGNRSREARLTLQKSMTGLLLSGAANEERGQPGFMQDPDDILRRMLPDRLSAFFSADRTGKAYWPSTGWRALPGRVKSWIHRSTRRPPIDTFDSIEEILHHLEMYLEKPNESTHTPPHGH